MVTIFHRAASEVRDAALTGGARTPEEQAHWVMVAMRAWRAGDVAGTRRAARAVPALAALVDASGALEVGKARLLLASLVEHSLDGSGGEEPELGSEGESFRVLEQRRFWRSERKVRTPLHVLNPDGTELADSADGSRVLAEHWANVFRARRTNADSHRLVASCAPRWPDGVPTKISFEDFEALVRSRRDTAPRPDGIPWSAWKAAPARTMAALYASYEVALDGGPLPASWNMARVVFIPKAGGEGDAGTVPGALRPISLINTAAKAIACAVNVPLAMAAARMVGVEQQGFLRGRAAAQQIVRQDAWMTSLWEHTLDGGVHLSGSADGFPVALARLVV